MVAAAEDEKKETRQASLRCAQARPTGGKKREGHSEKTKKKQNRPRPKGSTREWSASPTSGSQLASQPASKSSQPAGPRVHQPLLASRSFWIGCCGGGGSGSGDGCAFVACAARVKESRATTPL